MQVKPLRGEAGRGLERAAFLEEVARSGYDLEVAAQRGGMCAVMVSAKALHGTADIGTHGPSPYAGTG